MTKQLILCKTGGNLGQVGKQFAMCGHAGFGDPTPCRAHGNKKCEHKIKPNSGSDSK